MHYREAKGCFPLGGIWNPWELIRDQKCPGLATSAQPGKTADVDLVLIGYAASLFSSFNGPFELKSSHSWTPSWWMQTENRKKAAASAATVISCGRLLSGSYQLLHYNGGPKRRLALLRFIQGFTLDPCNWKTCLKNKKLLSNTATHCINSTLLTNKC